MKKFTYVNNTEQEFEEFPIDRNSWVYAAQPSKLPGRYTPTVQVFLSKTDYDRSKNYHVKANQVALNAGKSVGVTAQTLAIGVPVGVYVPIQWNQYNGRFEIRTEELVNEELIYHADYAPKEKVQKAKEAVVTDEDSETP